MEVWILLPVVIRLATDTARMFLVSLDASLIVEQESVFS
jgi:hypothetical protein